MVDHLTAAQTKWVLCYLGGRLGRGGALFRGGTWGLGFVKSEQLVGGWAPQQQSSHSRSEIVLPKANPTCTFPTQNLPMTSSALAIVRLGGPAFGLELQVTGGGEGMLWRAEGGSSLTKGPRLGLQTPRVVS